MPPLQEYQKIISEINDNEQYGNAFVQSVFLAIHIYKDSQDRNSYIRTMGETFSIAPEKVNRITELLPS